MPNPLSRFLAKCRFDPCTGCVMWIGGKTKGADRVNNTEYGSFWFEGKSWYAHRWAAKFIHRLDIDNLTVGHTCPHGPNGLCVHHLEVQTNAFNVTERNLRRYYWKMVDLGYEEPEPIHKTDSGDLIPFYPVPDWFITAGTHAKHSDRR